MDKISILKNSLSMHGYSIEVGNTSYETTLDERIKAAKIASLISKQEEKQITIEDNFLINRNSVLSKKGANFKNMAVKKTTNIAKEFEMKNKCLQSVSKSYFEPTNNVISPRSPPSKNINTSSTSGKSSYTF